MLIDWSLVVTIGFVVIVSLVGAWLSSRRRDECLVGFEDYHVTLEHTDGRLIWGKLKVSPTGLELQYQRAVQDEEHVEASYVMYSGEYQAIQAIYRYADVLDAASQKRRAKEVKQWFNPGPLRFLLRRFRNFIGAASGSLNDVISLLMGRVRASPAASYFNETGETYLKRFSADLVGQAGSGEHDPLLEQFIGKRVVFEIGEDQEVHEHVGIFKNYTASFFEILDVQYPFAQKVPVEPFSTVITDRIIAVVKNGAVTLSNHCNYPILIVALEREGGDETLYNVLVDSGEEVSLPAPTANLNAHLQLKVMRELDMIVARSRAIIRHRAAVTEESRLSDIVFDLGTTLRRSDRKTAHEQRLREELAADPNDALAAANLGALLVQCEQYEEAATWLAAALERKDSLPDRGRRAEMQLRELQRRQRAVISAPATENDVRLEVHPGETTTIQVPNP